MSDPRPVTRTRRLLPRAVVTALVVAVGGFAATFTSASPAAASLPGTPSGWTQVFADDFTGAANTGLNTANWLYDIGTGYPGGAANWGTGEIETMTNSTANVYQDGSGHLVIKPIRDRQRQLDLAAGSRPSAPTSPPRPAASCGIEASIQQPNVSGAAAAGYWPAFWMLGAAARGSARPTGRASARSTSWRTSTAAAPCSRTLHCGVEPGRPVQRDHRPRQRRARLRRLPDRLPHLRGGVRPQRLAGADPLVPRRQQLLHRQRQPGRRDHLEQRHPPRLLHDPQRGDGRRLPGRVRRRPDRCDPSGVPMLVDYVAVYTTGGGSRVRRAAAAERQGDHQRQRPVPGRPLVEHRQRHPGADLHLQRHRRAAVDLRRGRQHAARRSASAWTSRAAAPPTARRCNIWDCNNTGAQVFIHAVQRIATTTRSPTSAWTTRAAPPRPAPRCRSGTATAPAPSTGTFPADAPVRLSTRKSGGQAHRAAAIVDGMEQDEIWNADAAQRYDTPGTGMFAPDVLGPAVDRLAELAGGGRALEFAIGTGRVAVPLAERGVPVTGIELSTAMIDQLRTKADEATIPVIVGDMATDDRARRVHAGLPRLQHHLQPAHPGRAGRVLPQRGPAPHPRRPVRDRALGAGAAPAPARVSRHGLHTEPGYIGLDTYDVLQPARRLAPLPLRRRHARRELFRSPHRYIWPAELDLMAQLAGFELESRHADWSGAEFTAESRSHVSVYRLPTDS